MASPNRQAIEKFMSITGVSEAIAVRKLEEHCSDVIRALNEHFDQGDRNVAGGVRETPIDVMDWNQGPTQAGHAHYSHQDEQTNKILSDNSLGGSAKGEPMIATDALTEYSRQLHQEDLDFERALSLSMEKADQEGAQGLQGNVSAPIVGPPESSGVEIGEIASSNRRLQAGRSFFQDEAEDAGEKPVFGNWSRLRTLGSTYFAENANVIDPTTMSSSGNMSQHNRNAIHEEELGGISTGEHDEALMPGTTMSGGIPEESGYGFSNDFMQYRISHPQPAPSPPSPSLIAQRLIREQQELETRLAAKKAALPPEPSSEDKNTVTLLVKMPDGSRHGRRFLGSDRLQSLFDFIDICRVVNPGTYRLVRPYPRRPFSDGEGALTLSEVGLINKQEVLYLDLI